MAAHLQCNASQVAHAIAWKMVCYGAVGVSIMWIIKVSPGAPDTFCFQTLKRASFYKTGRKMMVHIFVYQRKVQVYIYIPNIWHKKEF